MTRGSTTAPTGTPQDGGQDGGRDGGRGGGRPAKRWRRLPVAWRRALVATAALRALVGLVSVVAPRLFGTAEAVPVAAAEGFNGWVAAPASGLALVGAGLERFDALWYLAIAADGYPTTEAVPQAVAFFPGFPALVALVGALLGGRLLLASHVVALAATVAAFAGVHELVRAMATRRRTRLAAADAHARRAVLLLACFPTAFFLVAPYSESLFLATTAWTLVLAGRGRWVAAAALGFVAGTIRPLGVVLALPLLLAGPRDAPLQRWLVTVAAPAAGLASVLVAGWVGYGTPLAALESQGAWQRSPRAPWDVLADAVRFGLDGLGGGQTAYHLLDLLVFVPVVVAVAWLLVRAPRLGLYALAHVAVWFALPFAGRPLLSTPRFALGIAPLPAAFAAWTRRRWVLALLVTAFAGLQLVHLALFTTWRLVF